MEVFTVKSRHNEIFLIPIGDIHMGDRCFDSKSREKLQGYIDWVKSKSNAFIVLTGDLINSATLNSASSPFQQNMDMKTQIAEVVKMLKPVKNKIVGAITGNHEQRLERYCGYNPTISICDRLDIPYFGIDVILLFRMGCHGLKGCPRANFTVYVHHTTGGGSTVGGKINRVDKLRQCVANCDAYVGSHNHMLGCVHTQIYKVNENEGRVDALRQMLIDTGGFLNYEGSYANEKMLPPVKLGSPKIRLFIKRDSKDKVHKDIHVSL